MTSVAIVTPRYPPVSTGGGEQSAKLLATQLATQDRIDEVTVFSFDGTGSAVQDGVAVQRLGRVSPFITELQNISVGKKLSGRLSEFDVVHAYNMELHPVVGYLSKAEVVPAVGTLNSYHFFPSSVTNTTADGLEWLYERVGIPTTGRLMRQYVKQMDALVALSRAIRDIYVENGFDRDRIEHIPNMIDPEFEVPNSVEIEGTQLLYVGSLTEKKGVRFLIEAVSLLPEQYQLRIVGDGDRIANLRERAKKCGVADRTTFSGQIPYEQIGQVYADADIFVHPGIWPEPLNRTVLEAMQAALPVVCTEIGGPPEVIPSEELLCKPESPEALATAIQHVEEIPTGVGEQNRRYVMDHYSPSVIVPKIVTLYERLCSR